MDLNEILADGEAALARAVDARLAENLYLDFKGGDEALFREGSLTKDGRRSLAKALSAFSNSAGGVVVIGVNCRKVDGIDAATELQPIQSLSKALASLNEELGNLLQPRHDGLSLHAVPSQGSPTAGYIVVDVPRSERRPHMSNIEKTYHKRAGASSFVMEHYDVEDAFRRISSPILRLSWELFRDTNVRLEPMIDIRFTLTNDGVATAKHVSAIVERIEGPAVQIARDVYSDWDVASLGKRTRITAPPNLVLNPGQSVRFHHAHVPIVPDAAGQPTLGGWSPVATFLNLQVELSAENMWPSVTSLRLGPVDLLRFVI